MSYPLAAPRVYVSQQGVGSLRANLAEIWLRDPRNLNEVLVQARATSYGLRGLRFVTRSGVRVLLDQAAGIVIDLLVALSLIALATAAVMLAASARAELQRRLQAIGVRAVRSAPPAPTSPPDRGSRRCSSRQSRGWRASRSRWPRRRGRHGGPPAASPVALLCGAELGRGSRGSARMAAPRAGLTVLGARLVGARRTRLIATVAALGFSTAFVLLVLALASALSSLETDPQALGRRYQLTAQQPASAVPRVRAIPGVQAVAPRYEDQAVDSYSLGETIDVIAYPGNHTIFEDPPLVSGARMDGAHEAEVGLGLA